MIDLKNKKKEVLSKILGNIKLQDTGVKRKNTERSVSSDNSNKISYPSLYLNIKEVPQLKGYEVGDKVIFIMEAEVVGHNKNDDLYRSKESFDFSLKKIGCKNKGE